MANETVRGTRVLAATSWALLALGLITAAASCAGGGGGGGRRTGDAGTGLDPQLEATVEEILNASVTVANQGPDLQPDLDIDETITVTPAPTTPGAGPTVLNPGDVVPVSINFNAPNGNVVGAGIRFGTDGPIHQIELPDAEGLTQGALTFDIQIPDDICSNIGQICHDIQCYEFAVTSEGTLSAANIMPVGLACNGCSEPTCQELLMCEMPPGEVEVGMPCTPTDACVPGSECFNGFCVGSGTLRVSLAFDVISDYDLHVLTPNMVEIYYGGSGDGGTLDVDQCSPVSDCEGGGTHVENVVFDATAPTGTYEVWVENFSGTAGGPFTIEVSGDVTQTFSGSLTAVRGEESMHFTFTL